MHHASAYMHACTHAYMQEMFYSHKIIQHAHIPTLLFPFYKSVLPHRCTNTHGTHILNPSPSISNPGFLPHWCKNILQKRPLPAHLQTYMWQSKLNLVLFFSVDSSLCNIDFTVRECVFCGRRRESTFQILL